MINSSETAAIQPATLEQVLAFMDTVEPGKFDYDLFLKLAKRLTQATIELVPLRTNESGQTEVLLTRRPPNDPWGYEWHVPGTILLAGDEVTHPKDYSQAFGRLLGENGELKSGVQAVGDPVEVATERRITRRGPELSVLHYVRVVGEPVVGSFFAMDGFPGNVPGRGVIEHHADFIPRVVARYEADRLGIQA